MKSEGKSENCCGPMATRPKSDTSEQSEARLYVPPADIFEGKEGFVLLLDMPGVQEKDVNIDVEKNVLTVTGKVALSGQFEKQRGGGHELRYAEYGEGNYTRRFRLANGFDLGKVDASMKDGVLKIVLPKSAEVLPKKIQVRAA